MLNFPKAIDIHLVLQVTSQKKNDAVMAGKCDDKLKQELKGTYSAFENLLKQLQF